MKYRHGDDQTVVKKLQILKIANCAGIDPGRVRIADELQLNHFLTVCCFMCEYTIVTNVSIHIKFSSLKVFSDFLQFPLVE